MKTCSVCKTPKDETEFYLSRGKRVAACKPCRCKSNREGQDPERTKARELARRPQKAAYQRKRREDPEVRAHEQEYNRKNRANPEYIKEELRRGRAANKDRRNKLQLLKMDRPCYDCGGVFIPEVMEWDHLPGTIKCFNINTGPHRKLSEVVDEIAKCQLVCANCHRVRTVSRIKKEAK